MELHKKIKENRIQEICDKYIGESVKDNKPITKNDVASLSCAELIVLYYNTEWLIERSKGDRIDTGLENQILLMELIKERVNESTLYVIYTDATDMPFLTENKSILVYTEKRFADMVACSFNVEYFKEGSRFIALEVSGSKEAYWNKLRAAGINTISVDGTKFTVGTDDLVKNKENFENTEFCRFLIQYAQAIRLGIHRDKTSIFKEAILSKLKENPKIIHGSIISKGENKFLPLYVNASATNETTNISELKTGNFYAVCKEIFDNKNITGIVLNPERENIVVPSEKIIEAFDSLNVTVKNKFIKEYVKAQKKEVLIRCCKCGRMCRMEELDSNGVCPQCLKGGHKQTNKNTLADANTATAGIWMKCKRCGGMWLSTSLNEEGLCPTCVYEKKPPLINCKKCGKLWYMNKLNSDGICPKCVEEMQSKRNIKTKATSSKKPSEIWVQCKKCGVVWPPAKLNNDGWCPDCVRKAQNTTLSVTKPINSSAVGTQITNTVNRANLNRTLNRPKTQQEKNYALWCMICGIISIFLLFVSIFTFENALKAINQAKANGEAVSAKVWIGVAISVASILFFVFFLFLPMVLG